MNREDRVAGVAQRYIDDKLFAGLEWMVEQQGKSLTRGRKTALWF